MGWSNDELNEIFIYDPLTGTLILRIDRNGFYYVVGDATYLIDSTGLKARLTADNGSYIAMLPSDFYGGTRLNLNPSVTPTGTSWQVPGRVFAAFDTNGANDYSGWTIVSSPNIIENDESSAQLQLYTEATGASAVPSRIIAYADELLGKYFQQQSQGACDWYPGTSFLNTTTATYQMIDSLNGWYYGGGPLQPSRVYNASFTGTMQSTVAGDRVGLRIYKGPTFNSIVGATLVADYGTSLIHLANTPQPFSLNANTVGTTGDQYFILACNRVSGMGTCRVTTYSRQAVDLTVNA